MHLCASCHRHIRETACPFCGTVQQHIVQLRGGRAMWVGMPRAAVAIAGSLALAGCAASTGPSAAASVDAGYGIAVDAASDIGGDVTGDARDAAADGAVDALPDAPLPPYGLPPADR
jgi:hypothetical protein